MPAIAPSSPPSPRSPMTARERLVTAVYDDAAQVAIAVAQEIASLIRERAAAGQMAVLGLATGSTPVGVYDELVRMHNEQKLSFKNVITFNLDEYFPMQRKELQSYHRFMREHLHDLVDIDPGNAHIPDGTLDIADVQQHCIDYEKKIDDAGGIDIQLLGIGRTGHIGFNEPGSSKESLTRLITLDRVTRLDAASDFFGEEYVPRRAITMGVGTILKAKRIFLLAFGEHKAPIIAQAVEGDISPHVSASYLQEHDNAQVMLDTAAAAELTRYNTPWLLGPVDWDAQRIRKATIWLARHLKKPILKLTEGDYNEAGLQDLLAGHGPAYEINIQVFRSLQDTITGWPGGKPAGRAAERPTPNRRAGDDIFPKRVVIFSPHPDDDVISMGGTLLRLVDQGHEVHVAYQTSGNIAVFDEDAIRFADFANEFNAMFGIDPENTAKIEEHIEEFLRNKEPGQVDSPKVQKIKGLIRRGEARAAGRYCGVPYEQLHFLDMPFYETGRVRKNPPDEKDEKKVADLLQQVKPHQIYAAGDLSDPHGTHRVCLNVIFKVMHDLANEDWAKQCVLWLYRGAWQEWGVEDIEMAVPIAPVELMRKRKAIFKHESQKDAALFPGTDTREFWERAEDRNRATAQLYDQLGLAEYEAIEGFVRWKG